MKYHLQLIEDHATEAVSPHSHAPPRHRPSPVWNPQYSRERVAGEKHGGPTLSSCFLPRRDTPIELMISINPGLYSYQNTSPNPASGLPPSSTIFARCGETIGPLLVISKTADQLRRIRNPITGDFIFCDFDEEQETGVLNAMQEMKVDTSEVVIRQGDFREYFFRSPKLLHRPEPLPPSQMPSQFSQISLPRRSFSNQTITQTLASDILCMPPGQKRWPTCWPCR